MTSSRTESRLPAITTPSSVYVRPDCGYCGGRGYLEVTVSATIRPVGEQQALNLVA
ncbi:MAG TPA: hypothetical protein VMU75_16305 [Acidimicrobiales bacterium]|nr:hypothetical protein [Acidimicrobiales bacterium]